MPNIETERQQARYETLQDLWLRDISVDDAFEEIDPWVNEHSAPGDGDADTVSQPPTDGEAG